MVDVFLALPFPSISGGKEKVLHFAAGLDFSVTGGKILKFGFRDQDFF